MKHPEKIAVLGGTGKAGQYLIKQLLKQGYFVKALARNPKKLEQAGPLLEIIQGNARDYGSIHNLLAGCDAVISTLGPSGKDTDTCSMAVGHVIKTMYELNIPRYIEVAGLGIDAPGDHKGFQTRLIVSILKRFFPAVLEDRQKCYQILKESKIQWTIVRCPMIKLSDSTGPIKTSLRDSPGSKISAAALAEFLVNQLYQDQFVNKAPFISN